MIKKPPVVVVLGHIDHGKTTLLDAIRKTSVTAKEAGGITQSIGAYQIKLKAKSEKRKTETGLITFIDTPGHEAFSKMRSHGAKAADIAILVIAADEGIKPQTIEAIKDIKSAAIPFLVALNKMDNSIADPQKVKQELTSQGVFVEGRGGDVPVVEVSAKTGKGVPQLLDLLFLMAEVEGLKVDPAKPANGIVIAASHDSREGLKATLIVKEGTLKEGGLLVFKTTYGKVRAMTDFEGKRIKTAGPSTPVRILGLEGLPEVGELWKTASSLEEAKKTAFPREALEENEIVQDAATSQKKEIKFILRAEEKASLHAMQNLFSQIEPQFPDVRLRIIRSSVGDVSLNTITLAKEFGAYILGFGVKVPASLSAVARQEHVPIKTFHIIYELLTLVQEIVRAVATPLQEIKKPGELTILATFSKDKKNQVLGGKVAEGAIKKGGLLQIKRDGSIVGKGKILNLQHAKKDVSIVENSKECGMLFQSETEIMVGDSLVEDSN